MNLFLQLYNLLVRRFNKGSQGTKICNEIVESGVAEEYLQHSILTLELLAQ